MQPAQIKVVSHRYFQGILDKNNTVKAMSVKEARETLDALGYKKKKETRAHGCIVEIWELPEHRQTK